jgi:two-component system, chemotaxis family, CheB/CheR fusion protein
MGRFKSEPTPGLWPESDLEFCAAMLERAPLPMALVHGPEHSVRAVNPAFCKWMDKPKAALIGKPFAELVPEGDACLTLLDRVLATGEALKHDEKLGVQSPAVFGSYALWPWMAGVRASGILIQVTDFAAPDEKTVAVNEALILASLRQHELTAAADALNARLQQEIDERIRIEEALRRSEQRFRALFASVPVATFVCDQSGVVESFNQRAAELWGREPKCGDPRERFCGPARLFSADGVQLTEAERPMVKALQTGVSIQNVELLIERLDGSRIAVIGNFKTLKDGQGRITGVVTSFDDLTEIKLAQAQARASGERFHLIAEALPQLIATAGPTGEMEYFNPRWTTFTGRTLDELRGWSWTECLHPDDAAHSMQQWKHSLESGKPLQLEHRLRRADGEYRWHVTSVKPMHDYLNNTLMWLGSSTDIQEVKEADTRKNEFLAMLAHELRNPLAPIRYMLDVVKRSNGQGELIMPALDTMERQVGQMTRLIDDLLDVGRISQGKLQLRREEVDLSAVIRLAVESSHSSCASAEQELTVKLPSEPIYLYADPVRLAQVFGNLLHNACKFARPRGQILLSVEQDGNDVVIRVKDSGIGIPIHMLSKIFEIFTQGDQSLERSQGGLGIGLTLVRRLVELHGGSVQAFSAGVDQGSEFVVRLPALTQKTKLLTRGPEVGAAAAAAGRRYLVVDDNHDSANALSMLLRMAGNETRIAFDGVEAVKAAGEFVPHVILLDLGMPKLSGFDAAREIRKQPWSKGMILVAVTGWGQDEDRKKTKDAGFDAHVVKPVRFDALAKLVESLAGAATSR